LYDAFKSFGRKEVIRIGLIAAAGLLVAVALDAGSPVSMPNALTWLIISAIGGGSLLLMMGLRKAIQNDKHGALVSVLLCVAVPLVMGVQGWDDHDRSDKTTAHNVALNYLNSCPENGIVFTNGDNDTFPLWYMQEVEGKRVDVRVCNLSLMQTDWYTNQMKMKAYTSDALPIKFTADQIQMYSGNTDQVLFLDLIELILRNVPKEIVLQVIDMRVRANPNEVKAAVAALNSNGGALINAAAAVDNVAVARLNDIKAKFSLPLTKENKAEQIYSKYLMATEVLSASQTGLIKLDQAAAQKLQTLIFDFDKTWNYANLSDAMAFTRNDDNIISISAQGQGERKIRIFPANAFVYPVNVDNAVKSGVILESQRDQCVSEIRFDFANERGLTREQVMMLDIIANNNWKRGISFSSPGGSDVSIALYRRGHVKQNGMVFELSPLDNPNDRYNDEKMYDNLMKKYDYGTMSDPNVLTDYYARRHTDQYRLHFLSLAEEFISKAFAAENQNEQIANILKSGQQVAGLPEKVSAAKIKEYKEKAKKLILRSLEVMPAALVMDYGEPNANGDPRDKYQVNGVELTKFNDGVLHDYVGILLMAGDKASAEKLGMTVADQLESIINYYDKTNVAIGMKAGNTDDLYAALDAYLKMMSAVHEFGDANSKLATRMRNKVDYIYKKMMPSIKNRISELANKNGESTRRGANAGYYAKMLFNFEDYMDGIAIAYELMEKPEVGNGGQPGAPAGQSMTPEQFQQLMNGNQ